MSERLSYLFDRHLQRSLTPEERVELMGLLLEPSLQQQVTELVGQVWETSGEELGLEPGKKQQILQTIFKEKTEAPVIDLYQKNKAGWKKWMIAASVILLAGIAGYLLWSSGQNTKSPDQSTLAKKDIEAPRTTRAMITLADGRRISLDSLTAINEGTVTVTKNEKGEISYQLAASSGQSAELYNTLSNPRGSKVIGMTLSDGSRVWLNAGSSVTYPVAFINNERKVTITGEAYFEVAHDKTKPFIVSKGEMSVTVLGTHFNVNAYDDEQDIKVTLLEGSVKVNDKIIKPGQQAQVMGTVKIIDNIDIEQVMAWKNGFFGFRNADLKTVMRQLSRWYDIDVSYEGVSGSDRFTGEIDRNISLAKLLDNLAKSRIHFRIQGRKLIVVQ